MQITRSFFVSSALFCISDASGMEVRKLQRMAAQTVLQQFNDLKVGVPSADGMHDSPVGEGGLKRGRDEVSTLEPCDKALGLEYCLQNYEASWKKLAQRFTLEGGHKRNILCCGFIRNKRLAYSACAGGLFCLWDLADLKVDCPTYTQAHHAKNIYSVAVSNDQQFILTGSEDKTAKLWRLIIAEDENLSGRVVSVEHVATFEHAAAVTAVAFSHDGRKIATGSKDGFVRIFNISGLVTSEQLKSSTTQVLAETAQSMLLVSQKEGRNLILVKRIVFSDDDSEVMACGGVVGCSKRWSCATGELIDEQTLERLELITTWGYMKGQFVPCYGSGHIGITDVDGHKKHKIHSGPLNHIHFSPDQRFMVTGTSFNGPENPAKIYLWRYNADPKTVVDMNSPVASPITTLLESKLFVSSLAMSSDNGELLCGDGAGNLVLWTIKPQAERLGLRGAQLVLGFTEEK